MRRVSRLFIGAAIVATVGLVAAPVTAALAAPAKKANAIAVTTAHAQLVRGSTAWTKLTVSIKNTGSKTAKRIVVSTGASKGARVKPGKIVVSSLKSGSTKKVTIKVRRVSASGTVKITAKSAAGAKATRRVSLTSPVPVVTPTPTPTPTTTSNELVGDGFWSYFYDIYSSADGYSQLYFVSDALAYWGMADKATPTCAAATITTLGDTDGCIAYTFDPARRSVSIGGKTATIDAKGGLAFDAASGGDTYELLVYPDAGTTLDVNLEHDGYSGCSGLAYCSTWTYSLAMNGAGQFVRSESSVTTFDVPGGPFTTAGDFPPDSYGTYSIVAKGLVELDFADGHVETLVLSYEVNAGGAAAPATEGLFLGADYYWVPTD